MIALKVVLNDRPFELWLIRTPLDDPHPRHTIEEPHEYGGGHTTNQTHSYWFADRICITAPPDGYHVTSEDLQLRYEILCKRGDMWPLGCTRLSKRSENAIDGNNFGRDKITGQFRIYGESLIRMVNRGEVLGLEYEPDLIQI